MPTSVAERQLWSIWIGYLLAFATMVVAVHFLTRQGVLTRGGAGPDGWQELILYPASAVLAGLAFFIMGSNFWGGCYTVGVVFFATAAVMPLVLPLAPLILGLTWSVTLTVIGLYIRRQAGGPGDEAGEGIKSREGVG